MANATIGQAVHILRIVEEKGTPKDQLQEIIKTGLLADLLDAKVGEVDREEFRRILGLTSLSPRYDLISYFQTRSGLWVLDSFRNLVVAKAKPNQEIRAVAMKSALLKRDMSDAKIEEMLGDGHIFTEDQLCTTIIEKIEKQWGGKEGELLNNGFANLFYTGSCVVRVYWYGDYREWHVRAWRRGGSGWRAGDRVFSPAN